MKIIAFVLSFAVLTAMPVRAFGEPVATKREQAVAVQKQVDELDTKVEIASEAYNEANAAYKKVTAKVTETEKRLKKLKARQDTLQSHLDTRVDGMYRSGPLGFLEILFGASSFEEFSTSWDLLQQLSEQDADAVAELKITRGEVSAAKAEPKTSQAQAKKERDALAKQKASIESQLAGRQKLLRGLESEIAQLEKEAEAAAARSWRPPSSGDSGGNPGTAPKSGIVAIAKSKLGAPYVWAADGPNSFDCSGFTMWVYAQVGVGLPHSSRAQYNSGPHVSKSNLQPGDLVFFGSPIHHVGIYVGGGQYIHAPHTGDVVKISSLSRSDYVGACRP